MSKKESHRVVMKTGVNSDNNNPETATAYATNWLLEEVGDIDVFHEVLSRTWKGDYHIHFLLQLSDEQLQTIKESDMVDHLEKLDSSEDTG